MVSREIKLASNRLLAVPALFILVLALASSAVAQNSVVLTASPARVAIGQAVTFSVNAKFGKFDPDHRTYEFDSYPDSPGIPASVERSGSQSITRQYPRPGFYWVMARILYSGDPGPRSNMVRIEVYDPAEQNASLVEPASHPNLMAMKTAGAIKVWTTDSCPLSANLVEEQWRVIVHDPVLGQEISSGSTINYTPADLSIKVAPDHEVYANQETRLTVGLSSPPPPGTTVRYCFVWDSYQKPVCESGPTVTLTHTYLEPRRTLLSVSAIINDRYTIGRSLPISVQNEPILAKPDATEAVWGRTPPSQDQAQPLPLEKRLAVQEAAATSQTVTQGRTVYPGIKMSSMTVDFSTAERALQTPANDELYPKANVQVVASPYPAAPVGTAVKNEATGYSDAGLAQSQRQKVNSPLVHGGGQASPRFVWWPWLVLLILYALYRSVRLRISLKVIATPDLFPYVTLRVQPAIEGAARTDGVRPFKSIAGTRTNNKEAEDVV